MRYPLALLKLIESLKRLPGVGTKSAERFAFHILDWNSQQIGDFVHHIGSVKENLKNCLECGCLMEKDLCAFCDLSKRMSNILCVVSSVKEVYMIEETKEYRGLYHVLGGLLSPIHGRTPRTLFLEKLKQRLIANPAICEVIIALDSTLEGDATALFLKKELNSLNIQTSRLALGLPMGSSLDFIDGGTLARALSGRHQF